MSDIDIRITGRAGRITLTRPKALNSLTYDMAMAIDAALKDWAGDDRVALVVIDAEGDKAFCAGGDIQQLYDHGLQGDYAFGQTFWRDEYRLNARLAEYAKPVVSFMQGFVMGGGVGVGCHVAHRVVDDSTQIAMPECGIGLIPDVGGTLILGRAPGRLGEYLGVTAGRMGPGDAIHAGFADYYLPEDRWSALIAELCETGDWEAVDRAALPPPASPLAEAQAEIDGLFGGETMGDIVRLLRHTDSELARTALAAIGKNAPLAMYCAVQLIRRARGLDDIRIALSQEYRYTSRAAAQGDFLEGIRAAVIDKDRAPRWTHPDAGAVPALAVYEMLRPLGPDALTFGEEEGRT
jgi:enoyl-CoA hydratase